jgi:hypothetical protein
LGRCLEFMSNPESLSVIKTIGFIACWQELFIFAGTSLTSSISFYPQIDGQAEMVNQRVERYLHDYVRSWIEWLHLGEHYCNTTHDSLSDHLDSTEDVCRHAQGGAQLRDWGRGFLEGAAT